MMLHMVASWRKSGQLGTLMVRAADNRGDTPTKSDRLNALHLRASTHYYDGTDRPVYCRVGTQPLLQLNSMIN